MWPVARRYTKSWMRQVPVKPEPCFRLVSLYCFVALFYLVCPWNLLSTAFKQVKSASFEIVSCPRLAAIFRLHNRYNLRTFFVEINWRFSLKNIKLCVFIEQLTKDVELWAPPGGHDVIWQAVNFINLPYDALWKLRKRTDECFNFVLGQRFSSNQGPETKVYHSILRLVNKRFQVLLRKKLEWCTIYIFKTLCGF
jgi:hypothetical protein